MKNIIGKIAEVGDFIMTWAIKIYSFFWFILLALSLLYITGYGIIQLVNWIVDSLLKLK